jgi:hypothetical protein
VDEVQIPENTDKYLDLIFTAAPPVTPGGAPATISANRISSSQEIAASEGVRVWSKTNCIQMPWAGPPVELSILDCRAAADAKLAGFESRQLKSLGLDLDKPMLIPTLASVTLEPFSTAMDGRIGVNAKGSTPTLGWTDAHLLSIDTAETSADKFIDIAFLIVPPNGETGQEVEEHTASRLFSKAEQGATTGIRVWAEDGCIVLPWTGDIVATVKPFADCVKEAGLVPVP